MKKILIAFNAADINLNIMDFACYIAKLSRSKLTGVFIEQLLGEEAPALKKAYGSAYVETIVAEDIPENKIRKNEWDRNIHFFEEACQTRGVNYSVHQDRGVPVEEIIMESRFADLLIVDPAMSLGEKTEGIPSHFVKEVLAKSECPVIIAPFGFDGIDEILFTYDGSASSVFSIKQFNYLFSELANTKVTVFQVKNNDEPVTEKDKIGELMQNYYSSIGYRTAQGTPENALFDYLLGKKKVFVVMGAYSRTMLSNFFKRSTADLIVKTIDLPFFIAHP